MSPHMFMTNYCGNLPYEWYSADVRCYSTAYWFHLHGNQQYVTTQQYRSQQYVTTQQYRSQQYVTTQQYQSGDNYGKKLRLLLGPP
jgi:hypothetical protein